VKGRFGHPFVNHEDRIRTPLIRYKKGGRLVPATWDDAIRHVAKNLDRIANDHGRNAVGIAASPRLTNESLYSLHKFATELVGTENFTSMDAFSLKPFLANLGGPLATHHEIRHAKTILLLGGEPEELQPLTGKQVRQAVRNGGAKLIIVNQTPIRLREQASQFVHIRPETEDAIVLALADSSNDVMVTRKTGVEQSELANLRQTISDTSGDLVVMFGRELSAEAQAVVAQLPRYLAREGRRVLLHPLPLFNNSIGAHLIGLMNGPMTASQLLDASGTSIKAMYVAGSFLPEQLRGREESLERLDFLVVQELFETDTTAFADVVLPAASFAEVDGTFTNNDGFVQRVRQSIPLLHESKPDWLITAQLAKELGVDFGFEMSASAVFRELASQVSSFKDLRYPLLKDEANPVQVKLGLVEKLDLSAQLDALAKKLAVMDETKAKINTTPDVGHELFKIGTLTDKVPQFHLLASGNPRPDTVRISPLYQITVDARLREEAVAGD